MKDLLDIVKIAIRGAWRYRWPAMLAAWSICLLGWMAVYSMPNVYEARAVVFVDAQSRLASVMGQVGVAPGVGSQVFVVRQAMLSRPLMESVAEKTGLDRRAATETEKEALMFDMLQNTTVESGRNREARDLYSITYRDSDRDMAVSVVTTLLNSFVQDVLKLKDQGADMVTGYLDDQLEYYGGLLSDAETGLAEFKKEYVGLLPGENGGVFDRLQTEMGALLQLRQDLQTDVDRRDELQRQLLSEVPNLPENTGSSSSSVGLTITADPTEVAIVDLQNRRNNLLLTYTERHPDVVAIGEQLEQLRVKRQEELQALRLSGNTGRAFSSTNPVYQSVQIALNDANVQIAGTRSEIAQREVALRRLRSEADTIPEVEAQYTQLTRNYAQYRELYNEIMVRKERERMGQVGAEREVVTFNVIDPPSASLDPVAPKRTLLLVGVLIVGLGGGMAVALMIHLVNPVFHEVNSLRELTGRPVLGAISMTWMDRYRTKRRLGVVGFSTAGFFLVALFVGCILVQDAGVQFVQSIGAN